MPDGVRHDVREGPLEEPGVGEHAWEVIRHVDQHPVRGRADAAQGDGDDLLQPHRQGVHVERSRLEAAHVEKVAHERVEPVGVLVDRMEELVSLGLGPHDVVGQERGDRGLDPGQWRAEVVRHCRQDRGPQLVRGGKGLGRRRVRLELLHVQGRSELARRTPRGEAVVRADRVPGQRQEVIVVHLELLTVERGRLARAHLRQPRRRRDRARA